MTTGNITMNNLAYEQGKYYAFYHGKYYSRVWNGSDRPKAPVTYSNRVVELVKSDGSKKTVIRRKKDRPPKRATQDVPHPYTTSLTVYTDPRCTVVRKNTPAYDYTTSIHALAGFPSRDGWSPGAIPDHQLLGKLREEIIGSDFNLGVFLAEGNQSLSMIANSAQSIARSIQFARRGNFREAFRAISTRSDGKTLQSKSKTTAGKWLELQYGWLPLLGDAESGAKFLAHSLNVPQSQRYQARVKKTGRVTHSFLTVQDGKWEETAQIVTYLKSADIVQLSGLTDVSSIVWEKLPFSFVADWFIPIGNYLSALNTARSLTGTFVITRMTKTYVNKLGCSPQGDILFIDGISSYRYSQVEMTRTVSSTLTVNKPSFKSADKIASFGHCLNAMALLTQVVSKK